MSPVFEFVRTKPQDCADVTALLDSALGPLRLKKPSHRFRAGLPPVGAHDWLARYDGRLVGTIGAVPVAVGDILERLLLLGPLAVAPSMQGRGIGAGLMAHCLAGAATAGYDAVILAGAPAYYGRFGFHLVDHGRISMPGQDPARLLLRELTTGAAAALHGEVRHWREVRWPRQPLRLSA